MKTIQRRTFLKGIGAAGATAMLPAGFLHTTVAAPRAESPDETLTALLDAAASQGAEYAEARSVFLQNQSMQARRDQLYSISDVESGGFALRVYKGGNWGFVSVGTSETIDVKKIAGRACAMAAAIGAFQRVPLRTSDRVSSGSHTWRTPKAVDPFSLGLKQKADFLLGLSSRPLKYDDIAYSVANLFCAKRESRYRNSLGGAVEQEQFFVYPNFAVTMFDASTRRIDSRTGRMEAVSGGFEACTETDFVGEIESAIGELREYAAAKALETGEYDLIVDPSHLWRLFYDSLATALDPQTLAGLDGGSPRNALFTMSDIGRKLFEAPGLNIDFDNQLAGGLASTGWDDAGHAAARGTIMQEGTLTALPGADEFDPDAGAGGPAIARSGGWQSPPRFAMPNLVLRPAATGSTIEELIGRTEKGLFLVGRGKPQLSGNRKWIQGSPQIAWLIEKGRRTRMVRDFQYNTSVTYLWSVLDDIGAASESLVAGDLFPSTANPIWEVPFSVAVPPVRFRNVPVVTLGQEASK
jgi:TldD protein